MSSTCPPSECEVLVIGAGVAGASAAHYLAAAGATGIVVIDGGRVGLGLDAGPSSKFHIPSSSGWAIPSFPYDLYSGSAVMPDPTSTIKFMMNIYPSSSNDFIKHHGREGARTYLSLARKGIELQKELAVSVLPNPDEQLRCHGLLYLAEENEQDLLLEEFQLLKSLDCDGIELLNEEELKKYVRNESFKLGIFFHNDAIINSSEYSRGLLRLSVASGRVTLYENCSRAVHIESNDDHALCTLDSGVRIKSRYIVLATGGFFCGGSDLPGLIRPCFSYLVSVADPMLTGPHQIEGDRDEYSCNYLSWGFTHDWCLTNGHYRLSGQDHFSALKDPKLRERTELLLQWLISKYPHLTSDGDIAKLKYTAQYGVYSETPDSLPIVGKTSESNRICYLLGCNAVGQASLTYSASLVPGILGYTAHTEEQTHALNFLSIRRFCLLPSVSK